MARNGELFRAIPSIASGDSQQATSALLPLGSGLAHHSTVGGGPDDRVARDDLCLAFSSLTSARTRTICGSATFRQPRQCRCLAPGLRLFAVDTQHRDPSTLVHTHRHRVPAISLAAMSAIRWIRTSMLENPNAFPVLFQHLHARMELRQAEAQEPSLAQAGPEPTGQPNIRLAGSGKLRMQKRR